MYQGIADLRTLPLKAVDITGSGRHKIGIVHPNALKDDIIFPLT